MFGLHFVLMSSGTGDFQQAHIGTKHKTDDAEYDQQQILPQTPIVGAQARLLPICDQLDNWREHEAECAQAHGTN